jgi:transposase
LWGRESKRLSLEVCLNTQIKTIQPIIEAKTPKNCLVCTDESHAYNAISSSGRTHKTVCHSAKEFAKDLDGDGFYEIHCNSNEGIWTSLRNFIRPFRGVNKRYLAQYVAVFELTFNVKWVNNQIIQAMCTPDFELHIT